VVALTTRIAGTRAPSSSASGMPPPAGSRWRSVEPPQIPR